MNRYKTKINISDQKILKIIQLCDTLALTGLYLIPIKNMLMIIKDFPLLWLLYYEVVLKYQSYLFNSGKYSKACQLILKILYSLIKPDDYYLCRFYLAYGSIKYKLISNTVGDNVLYSLLYYNKSKLLFLKLYELKDLRVVHNLLLKIKIFLNIMLMTYQKQERVSLDIMEAYSIGHWMYNSKIMMSNNTGLDVVLKDGKRIKVNMLLSSLLLNLLDIKKLVFLLDLKLIVDYYKIFYLMVLSTIITDSVFSNVHYVKIGLRVYKSLLIILIYYLTVYTILLLKLSYRNKMSFLRVSSSVFSLMRLVFFTFSTAFVNLKLIDRHNYFILRLAFHDKLYTSLLLYYDNNVFNLLISRNILSYKTSISLMDDILQINNIERFVFLILRFKYYYTFINNLNKKITEGINVDQLLLLISLYSLNKSLNGLSILLYNNMTLIFKSTLKKLVIIKYMLRIKNRLTKKLNEIKDLSFILLYVSFITNLTSITKILGLLHYLNNNILMYRSCTLQVRIYLSIIKLYSQSSMKQNLISTSNTISLKTNYIKLLLQSNVILLNFAYILAHDLRTTLRSITSFSQLLLILNSNQLDLLGKLSIKFIRLNCDKMNNLILSSLYYAQIGKLIKKLDFNFKLCVLNATQNTLIKIIAKDIKLNINYLLLPLIVYGDKILITNVVTNLISNSIKAVGTKNPIILIGRYKENWIYIKDNGRGMNRKQQERMFNLFYKGNNLQEGTGLGLAIVKRILEKHRSNIIILSLVGKGTTIYFSLSVVK